MSRRRLTAESVAALAALAGGAVLFALNREVRSDSIFSVWDMITQLAPTAAFFVTGLVLRLRRPGNRVGGICFLVGLLGFVSWLATEYAGYGLLTHPGSLRGALEAEIVLQSSWAPEIVFIVVLVCVFPDGRLLPGRWRLVPWVSAAAFGTLFAFGMTTTAPAPFRHVHNPLHVSTSVPLLLAVIVAVPLAIASVAGAVATVVVRYRRARPDEREQLKWLILSAGVLPAGLLAHSLADAGGSGDGPIELVNSFAIMGIPIAICIAVLKYRLYEIDRIVSRTLSYGVLSAVLAGSYVAIVLALQAAFGSVTQGNGLAVACSTLVVAALFRPLRTRVQATVDRRFYRSRVNAEETLARFGARVRHEADLETLLAELRAVVGHTLAPAHVSLWLPSDAELARNASETAME